MKDLERHSKGNGKTSAAALMYDESLLSGDEVQWVSVLVDIPTIKFH
jgi:hypothetical protein